MQKLSSVAVFINQEQLRTVHEGEDMRAREGIGGCEILTWKMIRVQAWKTHSSIAATSGAKTIIERKALIVDECLGRQAVGKRVLRFYSRLL